MSIKLKDEDKKRYAANRERKYAIGTEKKPKGKYLIT